MSHTAANRRGYPVRTPKDSVQCWTHRLWSLALAPSTRKSYASGLRVYQQFLHFLRDRRPLSMCFNESNILNFISYCFRFLHLRAGSIRSYLAAIRYFCLSSHLKDPLRSSNGTPKFSVRTLMKATEKFQKRARCSRLPITNLLLLRILSCLDGTYFGAYWDALLRASLCCAFYGFLRLGEFTSDHFSARRNLTYSDLKLSANRAILFLKRSKTDRTNMGVHIPYYKTHHQLCPVQQLHRYIKLRLRIFNPMNDHRTPLFLMPNGNALNRREFVKRVRDILSHLGYDASRYTGHSLRIGAASSAAKAGVPIYLIKILGRWSSEAYRRYITVSPSTFSKAFVLMTRTSS